MNLANIQATIDVLKTAQNFYVGDFQVKKNGGDYVTTVEELHRCGNSACIAGSVAVSPAFHAWGGVCSKSDVPSISNLTGFDGAEEAMERYWGMDKEDVSAIIYGESWSGFVATYGLKGLPQDWYDMTKEQAISLFEQLLEQHEAQK